MITDEQIKAIFQKVYSIVGELYDVPTAKIQAQEAREYLYKENLTKDELRRVFLDGAGFLTSKISNLSKQELRERIIEECLMSFDISIDCYGAASEEVLSDGKVIGFACEIGGDKETPYMEVRKDIKMINTLGGGFVKPRIVKQSISDIPKK